MKVLAFVEELGDMLDRDVCFKVALKRPVRQNWADRLQVVHVGSPLRIPNIKTRRLRQVSRIGMRVGSRCCQSSQVFWFLSMSRSWNAMDLS